MRLAMHANLYCAFLLGSKSHGVQRGLLADKRAPALQLNRLTIKAVAPTYKLFGWCITLISAQGMVFCQHCKDITPISQTDLLQRIFTIRVSAVSQ